MDVCINEKDLLGEPKEGRRFKGVIWLQGRLNYPDQFRGKNGYEKYSYYQSVEYWKRGRGPASNTRIYEFFCWYKKHRTAERFYRRISGKTIVNLGCTTGSNDIAVAFSATNTYIAPCDYIDGNAVLFFTIKLFYELTSKQCAIKTAYLSARETDDETQLFCLYQNGIKQ